MHYKMFMVVRINQNQRQELYVRSFYEMLGQKTVNRALAGVSWCISGVALICSSGEPSKVPWKSPSMLKW